MNKQPTMNGKMLAAIVAISALLASCTHIPPGSGPKGGKPNPWVIEFDFQGANFCQVDGASIAPENTPCAQNPQSDFCIGRDKWVQWESTPPRKYRVYFAPSSSASARAGGNGIAKLKIKDDAPFAYYKYTILADDCNRDTDGFDPRMRVDN